MRPSRNAPAKANCGTAVAALWLGSDAVVVMDPFYGSAGVRESGNYPIFLSGPGFACCPGQAMAHSEQGSLGPGLHPQLGVDVLQVGGNRLAANVQFGSDLGVGPSLAEPHQHLCLAGRQP